MRVRVFSILLFLSVCGYGQDYLKFRNEFVNIEPQESRIVDYPGFKPGMIILGAFIVNEIILIAKPNNAYNMLICGCIYMVSYIVSTYVAYRSYKKFIYWHDL